MSDTQENTGLSHNDRSANPTTQEDDSLEQSIPIQPAEESQSQTQMDADNTQVPSTRRNQCPRTLTERGKALQKAKLNDLKKEFEHKYKRWKYHINGLKRAFKNSDKE